jgi:hypothetical protein
MTVKVIQWATGTIGTATLKEIITHRDSDLVGVKVYNPDKHGIDAGKLCGMPPTGVIATSSRNELLALDADVVIHTAKAYGVLDEMLDEVCAILESGKDVITVAYYVAPEIQEPQIVERIEAACRTGNSTFHGTGIDPGFVCDRLPATLTSCSREVDHIRMLEAADISYHPNSDFMIPLLGFGVDPEQLKLSEPTDGLLYMMKFFPEAIGSLMRLLNVPLERVDLDPLAIIPATKDIDLSFGRIAKGTMAGVTWLFKGYRPGDDEPFVTHQWSWYVEKGLPDLPVCDGKYTIKLDIFGRPQLNMTLDFTDPEDAIWMPTGMAAFRMIPEVIAAPPGILRTTVSGAWRPRFA